MTNDNTTGQKRAAKGGEFGANGEWYKGGEFIATTDHTKGGRQDADRPTPEWVTAQQDRTARVAAWLESRRAEHADLIRSLTVKPVGAVWSDEQWTRMVQNYAAGFLPSLGQQLFEVGYLSDKQAEAVAKQVFGRQTKKNMDAWDVLVENLTTRFAE